MAAKKQKRVIHYGSVGSGGLAFRCYFDELNKHLKSGSPAKSKGGYVDITKYTLPNPLTTTDLRKVTCPDCWGSIYEMAKKTHQNRSG